MRRTLFTVMIALAVLTGAYGIAGAASGPHTDYRPGYGGGCGNSAACHSVTASKFLPTNLDTTAAPNEADYTSFCLACHNAAGEAHNKSAGSPSNNVYSGSTTVSLGTGGVSHSWNGKNHNAGTSTPTSAGFISSVNGADYMPGASNRVTCQTCHSGMDKSAAQDIENWVPATWQSGNNYTFGYANTSQYLAHYIKVYRTSSYMSAPANTRTKDSYLVDPSEYTYNSSNATITFNSSQTGSYIYVEIPQPYLRVDNTANAVCLDCHRDRTYSSVTHAPGTGVTNGHPVSVAYGHTSGLNNTIKPSATGNVYIENVSGTPTVLCTTCHDPHNSASNNGQILRETDQSALCLDCHNNSGAGALANHSGVEHSANGEPATVCLDCHITHGSNNILMIKDVINGKHINFQSFTGVRGFGADTGNSVCEACHTRTNVHLASNDPGGQGHNTGKDCTSCHKHSNGFRAPGSGDGNGPFGYACDTCHEYPGSPTSDWPSTNGHSVRASVDQNSTPGLTAAGHLKHLNVATAYNANTDTYASVTADVNKCGKCHPNVPSNHMDGSIELTANVRGFNGGTFNIAVTQTGSRVQCSNVACHFNRTTPNWW